MYELIFYCLYLAILVVSLTLFLFSLWKIYFPSQNNIIPINHQFPQTVVPEVHFQPIIRPLVDFSCLFATNNTPGFSYLLLIHVDYKLPVSKFLKSAPTFLLFARHIESHQSEDGMDERINALIDVNKMVAFVIHGNSQGLSLRIIQVASFFIHVGEDAPRGYQFATIRDFMYRFCNEVSPDKIRFI
jgi:hypothetical protein